MSPDIQSLPLAPHWALAAGMAGRGLIWAALLCFIYSLVSWARAKEKSPSFKASFGLGVIFLFGAFVCLGSLFVSNQFEFNYVYGHGDADTELRYKIAGIWSGQQGSFLLWACTSSLFGWLAASRSGIYRRWFTVAYSTFLSCLCAILSYETPFQLNAILNGHVPPHGAGLTPSLQNYWVVIHPPTIFTGFGSLTVACAFGISAILTGDLRSWIPLLRPWALISTGVLGLGLCMGGFWAYETLGWGGFWMWDPVENVSFVPWIFSAALLHGIIMQVNKGKWFSTNLVLAGLPFLTFCYGTFLTRSGFLSEASVHSFAEMNRTALWILGIFVVGSFLFYYLLWFLKGRAMAKPLEKVDIAEETLTRSAMYSSGVMLLCGLATATAVGMSVPFVMGITNHNSKVVEEPLYHQVVVWFFLPIMLLVGVAPFVSWKGLGYEELFKRMEWVAGITLALVGIVLGLTKILGWASLNEKIDFPFHLHVPLIPWMLVLVGVCIFAATSNTWRLIETYGKSKLGVGGFIAHIGLAVLMSGLIISRGFERKEQVLLQGDQPVPALDYTIRYMGMSRPEEEGVMKRDNKVLFEVDGPGGNFTARPGLYYIHDDKGNLSPMVWPHLEHEFTHDIYFSLHPPQFDVWENPTSFAPGQTQNVEGKDIVVSYLGYKMVGKGGQAGTKFVADLDVKVKDEKGVWHEHESQPSIEITPQGPVSNLAGIDDNLVISMDSINAGDKSAMFQVHFANPVYPIDLFYKPMVILVWLGAGIMTFGSLLAAFYRRAKQPSAKPLVIVEKPIGEPEERRESA